MDLNDLKSEWQNVGGATKSEEDLKRMTRIVNHPSIKKIRIKLIIQITVLIFILCIYYDWFDGDQKPFYANLTLILGILLYIFNDVIGYVVLMGPIQGSDLKISVRHYMNSLNRFSISSIIITCLYSLSIIIFFTSGNNITKEKGLLLVFSCVIVCQLILFSFRIWRKRIQNLKELVKDFDTY